MHQNAALAHRLLLSGKGMPLSYAPPVKIVHFAKIVSAQKTFVSSAAHIFTIWIKNNTFRRFCQVKCYYFGTYHKSRPPLLFISLISMKNVGYFPKYAPFLPPRSTASFDISFSTVRTPSKSCEFSVFLFEYSAFYRPIVPVFPCKSSTVVLNYSCRINRRPGINSFLRRGRYGQANNSYHRR